jgi:hypothetical protein
LKEIILGVKGVQEETKDTGVIINPSGLLNDKHGDKYLKSDGWR